MKGYDAIITRRRRPGERKKYPCEDCRSCQLCCESRCALCRRNTQKGNRLSIEEQIALYNSRNDHRFSF
jgi:MinD superfamily P-loop ATPase